MRGWFRRALVSEAPDITGEIATLRAALDAARTLIRERDMRLEKLEALARMHFGTGTYELLRERDQRISDLERELETARRRAADGEAALRDVASKLWQQAPPEEPAVTPRAGIGRERAA